jgi:hypothetical protein
VVTLPVMGLKLTGVFQQYLKAGGSASFCVGNVYYLTNPFVRWGVAPSYEGMRVFLLKLLVMRRREPSCVASVDVVE